MGAERITSTFLSQLLKKIQNLGLGANQGEFITSFSFLNIPFKNFPQRGLFNTFISLSPYLPSTVHTHLHFSPVFYGGIKEGDISSLKSMSLESFNYQSSTCLIAE